MTWKAEAYRTITAEQRRIAEGMGLREVPATGAAAAALGVILDHVMEAETPTPRAALRVAIAKVDA